MRVTKDEVSVEKACRQSFRYRSGAVSSFFSRDSQCRGADHGQLDGEFPGRDVRVVNDGEVRAHVQIGDRICVR